ncbi:SIMPL domain-containing protein [Roseateles sp. BYS78W]|uniref:SIMPL domain-containing protein n=1 Tax=Pelomonas candidula TaxID=3299025 RepID=A0ABW7HHA1_9BURK
MRAVILCSAFVMTLSAQAGTEPPRDRLSLSASASTEVTRDVLGIAFSTAREGTDPAQVQTALKQALDAALTEARRIAHPGQVDVQTGNFSLTPRYDPKTGRINGWQGSAELLVEGRDTAAIAQLAGRISTLAVQRVGYSLSREAREKVEGEVAAQAIARYRAKAADYSRQFGYGGFVLGEVSINAEEAVPRPAFKVMRAAVSSSVADEALPTEAGKATVSVTVSGSVQLTRETVLR